MISNYCDQEPNFKFFKKRNEEFGIHYFSRTSGLNILMDNVRPDPADYSLAPQYVSIALTNSCELSCEHCYAPKHHAAIDLDQLKIWLQELDRAGCFGVGFGGGEPTLYPKFLELCEFVVLQTGLAVSFTTHGHRIDESIAKRLKGNVHFIRLSMDGVGQTYEKIRGKYFDEFLKKLDLVRTISPFGINYLINDETLNDLDKAVELAIEKKASQFLLIPEVKDGASLKINEAAISKINHTISMNSKKIQFSVSELGSYELKILKHDLGDRGSRAYMHIDASAVLKKTSYDKIGVKISDHGLLSAIKELRGDRIK